MTVGDRKRSSSRATDKGVPWRGLLGRWGCVLVGVLWIWAAVVKLADPGGFARQIEGYRLIGAWGAALLSVYLSWLELVLGCALFSVTYRDAARWLSVGLLMVFSGALASAIVRGIDVNCGCFGTGGSFMGAYGALLRDVVLILVLVRPWSCRAEGAPHG